MFSFCFITLSKQEDEKLFVDNWKRFFKVLKMFVASSKTTVADHPTIADRRLARELGEPKAKLGRRRAAEKDGGGFVRSGRRGGRRDGFQRQECEEGIHQEGLCHHFGAGTAQHMEKKQKNFLLQYSFSFPSFYWHLDVWLLSTRVMRSSEYKLIETLKCSFVITLQRGIFLQGYQPTTMYWVAFGVSAIGSLVIIIAMACVRSLRV